MPFDPYNLTPNASINRVKLMSAPGLPEAWHGKTAYQVIGRENLVNRISEAFPELAPLEDPVQIFSEKYLVQEHPAALKIADEMGQALGFLLLTLKLGEVPNREARPQWDDSYWTHWGSIQQIVLGGGLMAGVLGKYMLAKAAKMLDGHVSLTLAKYPVAIPLIGAARVMTEAENSSWVFDFGGINIKRGHAIYTNGELTRLEQLPSIHITSFAETDNLLEFMVQAITSTISNHTPYETLFISSSIANYVHNCQLAPDTPYSRLSVFGEDICQMFSEAISQRMGNLVNTAFAHDGAAAAKAYAGAGVAHTAVITIGTALGMGFPPSPQSLRPLSADFLIEYLP